MLHGQRVLCILTSFWVLHAPESWSNYLFSAIFNLFRSFFTFFSGTPLGSRPAFACRPALKSRQKQVFLFIFRHFSVISAVKSLKKVWNEQKRLKTAEKSVSTSFWVRTAPKSWSKYTTKGLVQLAATLEDQSLDTHLLYFIFLPICRNSGIAQKKGCIYLLSKLT